MNIPISDTVDMSEIVQDYPEVFTTPPPCPTHPKPGHIPQEKVEQFFKEGYLIIEDFFKPEELQASRDACSDLVEELAQKLYNAGKIDRLFEEHDVFHRLTEIEKVYPGAAILMFKQGKMPQAFVDLWCHPRLLDMVEQFIGPDVAGHPVWNLRVKPPGNDYTTVPWHQDSAYFSEDSYDHMVLIAWIPLLDTHEKNGGMQVVRNAHRKGRVAQHNCCHADTWFVDLPETEIEKLLDGKIDEEIVTCRVPYGGMLLFNNITPHRSLPNVTEEIRWSIDLRWQSPHYRWGFYDIVEGVNFRSESDPNVKPDWQKFFSVNRKEVWQKKYCKTIEKADPFDTVVTGPWIGRWPIVNHNRHTRAFQTMLK